MKLYYKQWHNRHTNYKHTQAITVQCARLPRIMVVRIDWQTPCAANRTIAFASRYLYRDNNSKQSYSKEADVEVLKEKKHQRSHEFDYNIHGMLSFERSSFSKFSIRFSRCTHTNLGLSVLLCGTHTTYSHSSNCSIDVTINAFTCE